MPPTASVTRGITSDHSASTSPPPGNGTTEICVFCHTPHHTNTTNNLKPLWNRGTQAPASFTAYGSTMAGNSVASSDIGSTSLACLSCHDGTTTFDNLVNAPGKSGVTNGGADRGWTFWDAAVPGVVSDFMTSSRLNIGLNLSNDHPVSITYDAECRRPEAHQHRHRRHQRGPLSSPPQPRPSTTAT